MAGADFTIRVDGEEAVEKQLAQLAKRTDDLTSLLDPIGQTIESDIDDNFDGEHSPAGVPWKPSLRVLEHGGETGQDSRMMRLSMARRVTPRSVEVGTNKVYAGRFHAGFSGTEQVASHKRVMSQVFGVKLQSPIEVIVGSFTRKVNQVARPVVGVSTAAWGDIEVLVSEYVVPEQ